jgi:hypothetical protein
MGTIRRGLLGIATLAALTGLLTSCGASAGSGAASSPAAKSACQKVGAALSDGPDPDADPIGYALAQVLPLRAIKVPSDQSLQRAIDNLASAYRTFYDENGAGGGARRAVGQAAKKINALCPGAGAEV